MLVLLPHRSRALLYQKGPYPSLLSISTPSVLWKGNQLIYFQSCSLVLCIFELHTNGVTVHILLQMAFFLSLNTAEIYSLLLTGVAHSSPTLAQEPPFCPLLAQVCMYLQVTQDSVYSFTYPHQRNHTLYTLLFLDFLVVVQHFIPMAKPCYCMSQFLSTVMLLSILQTHYILSLLLLIRIWIVFYFEATMNKVLWTFLNTFLVDMCPHFSLSIYPGMSHTVYICFIFSKNCQFSKVVLTNY